MNAGDILHLLNRYFYFTHVGIAQTLVYSRKIILNSIANVLYRFLFGFPLRPASWKSWTIHCVPFFRLMKHD